METITQAFLLASLCQCSPPVVLMVRDPVYILFLFCFSLWG